MTTTAPSEGATTVPSARARPARSEQRRPTTRLAELRATTALLALGTAPAFLYVVLTPDEPQRLLLRAVVGGSMVLSLLVNLLAGPRFAVRARRGVGGLITVGVTISCVTTWVALDGGASSPLNAGFILPLSLAVAGAPSAAVVVGSLVVAGHLLGSAIGGPFSVATSAVWVSQFALSSVAISWVAGTRLRQRRRLRALTAELEQLATQDPLTRVLNRRGLAQALEELHAGPHGRTPTALLVADLDHFKDVNDRFGHAAGDAVLVAVADAIRHSIRDEDLVARTGGEEFAVVLADADAATAQAVAERIRAAIAGCHGTIAVTASIGVVTSEETSNEVERLHLAADRAMYLAKARGRDRVVLGDVSQFGHPAGTPRPGTEAAPPGGPPAAANG